MYNQIVMISHGINLLSYTTTYGSGRPIELEDPTIQLIEKTLQLCISAIDRYYRLFLALPKEGKFDPEEKDGRGKLEWEWQKGYIKDNMSVCLVIERDLARARGTLETMPKLNPNMPQTILESSDAQLVEGSLNNAANHQARILQSQICPIVQPQMNFTRQAETQNAYNEAQPEALEQFARVVASEKDATMSAEETSGTPTTTPAAAAAEDDQEGQEEEDVGALPMLGSNVLALLEAQVRRLEQSQRGGDGEEGEAEQDGDGEEREEEEEENGIPEQNTALPPISTNDANEGISSSGPEKVDLIVVSRRGSDAGVTNDGGGGNGEKGKDPSTFDVEDIVMEGLR
ncbi:hypothetical protein EJ08DRAFT_197771 [Tothia fuscella]|uniref:Uncharacterized protein n=1 Tax=Tothia fuscella TaxID=1048955 RepID=A0A9P4NTL8_9PEZI|nr:hypothetical protein EJ08DRAFT_197771 [Tothia fuscella]